MSFHRTILGVCTAVFATVFASAAFAQCCGGVAIAPVVAPVAVVQEVIQPVMAVQPVIPAVPVVAAPIAVDNWDTNGWGCGGVWRLRWLWRLRRVRRMWSLRFDLRLSSGAVATLCRQPRSRLCRSGNDGALRHVFAGRRPRRSRRLPLHRGSALRLWSALRLRPTVWLWPALWLRGALRLWRALRQRPPLRLRPLARLTRSCFQVIGEGLRFPRRPSFFVGSML